jgi:hypothetical protein
MFSGIRYIFGYAEESTSPTADNAPSAAPSVAQQNNNDTLSSPKLALSAQASLETSATKLEQTLNAATTKFTEQLLPQQASIEELQTSSHQLLPSITEQHEEDEIKKKKNDAAVCDDIELGKEQDEDEFDAGSWELLDLVEKAENDVAPVGLDSSAQKDGVDESSQGICKSPSGILKSQNACDANDGGSSQKRQKPKVSFEAAPDLVKVKQEIEQTKESAQAAPAPGKKQAKGTKDDNKVNWAAKDADCKKVPILNYAKALSIKLPTNASKVNDSEMTKDSAPCSSKTLDGAGSCSNGPVKRVRPTRASTSSWSSHDDESDIEQVNSADWDMAYEEPVEVSRANVQVVDVDDNESVVSSGFSDCDYGFGGINDYVVRPKKANARRARTVSGSSSLGGKAKSSRPDRKAPTPKAKSVSSVSETKNNEMTSKSSGNKSETTTAAAAAEAAAAAAATVSSRNSKPKKKRMLMSASKSVTLSDFLKCKPGPNNKEGGGRQSAMEAKTKAGASKETAQKATLNGGSTESSDVADMDESWFVTPPPCFTGAVVKSDESSKPGSPRTKEADRENALIEHPTVYIASAAPKKPAARAQTAASLASGSSTANRPKPVVAAGAAASRGTATELVAKSKRDGKSLMTFEGEFWNSNDDDDDDEDVLFDDEQFLPTSSSKMEKEQHASERNAAAGPVNACVLQATQGGGDGGFEAVRKRASAKQPRETTRKKKAPAKTSTVTKKPSESKAWKNKFIVDVWDLDDNDNVESDFDNLFEPTKDRKSSAKTKRQQQRRTKAKKSSEDADDENVLGSDEMIASCGASSSVELLSVKCLASHEFEDAENLEPPSGEQQNHVDAKHEVAQQRPSSASSSSSAAAQAATQKGVENRRPPIQVRPIEPERVPSWQLKRQRSKRRALATVSLVNKQLQQSAQQTVSASSGAGSSAKIPVKAREDSLASSSSSRSTPTLIDRIGCSIVANLTSLTSGLVSNGAANYCAASNGQSSMAEGGGGGCHERTIATKSNLNSLAASAQADRKRLSRGSMRRQNICAKQGNTLRRPDRRLKLFATPNGCSINRKVHTSIH